MRLHSIKISLISLILIFGISLNTEGQMIFNVIDSVPFGYEDEHGQPTGTHYDYLKAISERAGITAEIRIIPRIRIIKNFEEGKCDATIMFKTAISEDLAEDIALIRAIKIVAVNRKGTPLKAYPDLYKSKYIGIMRELKVSPQFDNDPNLNKESVNDYGTLIRMLLHEGRLDTVVGNAIVFSHMIHKYRAADKVELPGLTLAIKAQWFQLSKKSEHLDKRERIQEAISVLHKEGIFDQILTAHVGENWRVINQ